MVLKNTATPVQEVELEAGGYDLFSNVDNCKRGVATYVKKYLKASPSKIEELCDFDESIWCEISLKGLDRLLVGNIYRNPNSDATNNANFISSLRKVNENSNFTHVMICGDFNYPEINWIEETTPASPTNPATVFMECLRDCFLYQHVKLPTRYMPGKNQIQLTLSKPMREGW